MLQCMPMFHRFMENTVDFREHICGSIKVATKQATNQPTIWIYTLLAEYTKRRGKWMEKKLSEKKTQHYMLNIRKGGKGIIIQKFKVY